MNDLEKCNLIANALLTYKGRFTLAFNMAQPIRYHMGKGPRSERDFERAWKAEVVRIKLSHETDISNWEIIWIEATPKQKVKMLESMLRYRGVSINFYSLLKLARELNPSHMRKQMENLSLDETRKYLESTLGPKIPIEIETNK